MVPAGLEDVTVDAERFDFRTPRRIGVAQLDHAFTGLDGDGDDTVTARLTDAAGSGVEMAWDAACPWVQVYTSDGPAGDPTTRAAVAVEPMTCAPDAFNAASYPYDTGLVVLAFGGTAIVQWWIVVIG